LKHGGQQQVPALNKPAAAPDFASLNPGYALLFEVDAAASALCPAYFPVR